MLPGLSTIRPITEGETKNLHIIPPAPQAAPDWTTWTDTSRGIMMIMTEGMTEEQQLPAEAALICMSLEKEATKEEVLLCHLQEAAEIIHLMITGPDTGADLLLTDTVLEMPSCHLVVITRVATI